MRQSTQIADALQSAKIDQKARRRAAYERAIVECDEAWDAVLGAASTGLHGLTLDAYLLFKRAYRTKVDAWFAWRHA